MNLETLLPVFIVAILSIIGNIIFFKYQFRKDKKKFSNETVEGIINDIILKIISINIERGQTKKPLKLI